MRVARYSIYVNVGISELSFKSFGEISNNAQMEYE